MMGKSHFLSGWCAGVVLAPALGAQDVATVSTVGAVTAVAALIPDLDCGGSMLSRALGPVGWILSHALRSMSKLLYRVTKGPDDEDCEGGHRHASHCALFAVLVGFLTYLVCTAGSVADARMFAAAVAIGCLAHCCGDACTLAGDPILFPLPISGETWWEIHLLGPLSFRTGGVFERLVVTPGFTVLSVLLAPGVWPVFSSALHSKG